MNDVTLRPPKNTARYQVGAVLARAILNHPKTNDFPIESEHQLCQRFCVSRVTIRLVLGDLEHRGLIYRRHGIGTFAYGQATRRHRSLGIFVTSPDALRFAPVVEIIRGAHVILASLRASLFLVSVSPLEWSPEHFNHLGGVLSLHQGFTVEEIEALDRGHLPFLCLPEHYLTAVEHDFFELGQRAAESLARAFQVGEPMGTSPWPDET